MWAISLFRGANQAPMPMDSFFSRLKRSRLTRRDWIRGSGLAGLASVTGFAGLDPEAAASPAPTPAPQLATDVAGMMGAVGTVDHARNGFDPSEMLYDFDYGQVTRRAGQQTIREFQIVATDKEIEIAPGIFFPGWTYNNRIPGPTLRCVEGERVRVVFINASDHPHTIHFHGMHQAAMDGVPGAGDGMIYKGEQTVYEFTARPFGCHFYHCHAIPLKRHIHKGLYGAFIIDPDPDRYDGEEKMLARARNHNYDECKAVNEMVMVMNGFDTNFDGENEVYAANSIAFAYQKEPIKIKPEQKQRLYLANATEFDPLNSFHLHGNFFAYYDHGTTLRPTLPVVDTIMQCQGQRGIIEFSYEGFDPGSFMFHAHQSEFAELGWMGLFDVLPSEDVV